MALLQTLRFLVTERLSAAAEEICGTVGQIVAAYEDEAWTLKQEIDRKRKLLDVVLKPKSHRSDAVQLPICKEEVYLEHRINLAQEEPQPTEIKEEQEKLLRIPGGGLTPLAVKHECDGENREIETVTITTPGLLKPQASVEVVVEASDTEDIDGWEETSRSELNTRCGVCGKDFFRMCNLKAHMLTHTDEKPFTCTVCSKGCRTQGHLKMHMMTHTGERPFTCTLCGKGFVHTGNLKTHMLTHTDVRQFTCPVCDKSFKTQRQLKLHMMTHTGEKPFTCTVCGKGCRVQSDLKSHMMTHTGERPFSCTVCGKEFVTKNNLKTHIKKFH